MNRTARRARRLFWAEWKGPITVLLLLGAIALIGTSCATPQPCASSETSLVEMHPLADGGSATLVRKMTAPICTRGLFHAAPQPAGQAAEESDR